MDETAYLGLDAGASGGIAIIQGDTLTAYPMPDNDVDIWLILSRFIGKPAYALMEHVTGYVGDGGNPGSRMFTFGENSGVLKGQLVAANIKFVRVMASIWQKEMSIKQRMKGENKTAWKRRLKEFAEKLFPNDHITLKTCDAAILAELCRRRYAADTR